MTQLYLQKKINQLIKLYKKKEFSQIIHEVQMSNELCDSSNIIWNIAGASYQAIGNFEEAEKAFEKVVAISPEYADGHNNLGVLLKERKKNVEALESFKNAINLKPDFAQAFYNVGLVHQSEGEIALSIQAYEKAIILKKDYAEAYNNLGQAFKSLGKFQKALQAFEASTLHNPKNLVGLFNLGISYQENEEPEKAVKTYNKALLLNPNSPEIHNNIGLAHRQQKNSREAINSFKKAISLKPKFAEAFNNLGVALLDFDNFKDAEKAFKKSISLRACYSDAIINFSVSLQKQSRYDDALHEIKKAISITPNSAEVYNNKGLILFKLDQTEEAILAYEKALEIHPNYVEALNNKGVALRAQGHFEKAVFSYRDAIKIKPDYAKAYVNLGIALHDQALIEEAINSFKRATSLDNKLLEAFWNLAGVARNLNEATSYILQCLSIDPNYLPAQLILCALDYYKGDKRKFEAVLGTPLENDSRMRSFKWAFSLEKLPKLYFDRWALFDEMIKLSNKSRPFYEFGVWRGASFKYLIKSFEKGYGFDTFEGLPENWHKEKKGSYDSNSIVPNIARGEFIVGHFEETLPKFFTKRRPKASLINFDADLYSSTICALEACKTIIDENTILVFDEFLINQYWEQDEYKALNEFCDKNKYRYHVIALSFFSKQVAVKLVEI
jgi:tetratricopeptide (TPR) repeat protein